jgi:hypothetical protein
MSANKVLEFIENELASDNPTTTLMAAIKIMQPGIDRQVYDATQSATQAERTESVCRLLAAGMSVEEVVVLLCLRRDDVEEIAETKGEKIKKYAKTLKERQKRHGLEISK